MESRLIPILACEHTHGTVECDYAYFGCMLTTVHCVALTVAMEVNGVGVRSEQLLQYTDLVKVSVLLWSGVQPAHYADE